MLFRSEALAIRKQLVAEFPNRPIFRRALAMSHSNLGWVFYKTGRPQEAEAAYRDSLALYKRVVADFPNRPEFLLELAGSHHNLNHVLRDAGRPVEAEAARAEALAIYKQLVADFPSRPEFRQAFADAEPQEARAATGERAGDNGEKEIISGALGASDFPKK